MGKSSHGVIFGFGTQNSLCISAGYNWRDILIPSSEPIGMNKGIITEYSMKGLYVRPYISIFAGSVGPMFGASASVGTDMSQFVLRISPEAGFSIGGFMTFYYAINFAVLQNFTFGHEFGIRMYIIQFG